jgi:hypothetical protein
MQRTSLFILVLAVFALLFTSCDSGVDSPQVDPTMKAQVANALIETDGIVRSVVDNEMQVATPAASGDGTIQIDIAFNRTRACPLDGELNVAGEMHASIDFGTKTREISFDATKTMTDCRFEQDAQTVTINANAALDAFRRSVEGHPDGLQTVTYGGSITAMRDDGEPLSCDFNVSAELDPDAHTYTVNVSICGDEFTKTVTWNPDDVE